MCSVNKCVLLRLVRAQRGRVAIVLADNLRTHTAARSLLVRSLRSRIQGSLVSGVYPRLGP